MFEFTILITVSFLLYKWYTIEKEVEIMQSIVAKFVMMFAEEGIIKIERLDEDDVEL